MSLDSAIHRPWQESADPEGRVHVLVRFKNDVSALREIGCEVTAQAGDVASVFVRARRLEELRQHPEVVFVETPHTFKDETDLSAAYIKLVDTATNNRTVPGDGRGALIGIIDSGFDLTHPSLLDTRGRTRVVAAWDQVNLDGRAGRPPQGYGYGIEYARASIEEHIAARRVVAVRNHKDAGAHGTCVAGIAAGNGSPHGIYKGVAPEAELILVTYRNDVPVGGSAYVLDAIGYVRQHAESSGRPVVINMSQGDNLGSHDGTSLLERAIDQVVEEGRVLVVVSAGNERGGPACHHARGRVEQGRELALSFDLATGQGRCVDGDTIELWYRGGDRFAVALQAPSGARSEFVGPDGTGRVLEFPAGSRARVYSETNHPTNGDNRVSVVLERGDGWEAGLWQLILRGDMVRFGDFDAWADRPNAVTVIGFRSQQSDDSTITLPGNSRRAITVGGFISRPSRQENSSEVEGGFAPGSSIGPTRDGRIKPDLAAPSSLIMAPRIRKNDGEQCYDLRSGTSMAAPHVTGVIALLWGGWPGLESGRLRDTLLSTALADAFTGVTPNSNWGWGKLNAGAAYKSLVSLMKKGERMMSEASVFEFETNPRGNRYGDPVGMKIRIEIGESADLVITGTSTGASEGKSYRGTLTLRKTGGGALSIEEGGDECWVNGVWVSPCPTPDGGGGG